VLPFHSVEHLCDEQLAQSNLLAKVDVFRFDTSLLQCLKDFAPFLLEVSKSPSRWSRVQNMWQEFHFAAS
jgi:hypothetical protein